MWGITWALSGDFVDNIHADSSQETLPLCLWCASCLASIHLRPAYHELLVHSGQTCFLNEESWEDTKNHDSIYIYINYVLWTQIIIRCPNNHLPLVVNFSFCLAASRCPFPTTADGVPVAFFGRLGPISAGDRFGSNLVYHHWVQNWQEMDRGFLDKST